MSGISPKIPKRATTKPESISEMPCDPARNVRSPRDSRAISALVLPREGCPFRRYTIAGTHMTPSATRLSRLI